MWKYARFMLSTLAAKCLHSIAAISGINMSSTGVSDSLNLSLSVFPLSQFAVMPRFAEQVEVAIEALSTNPPQPFEENEFIDASRLVYDGVRDIRKAVLMIRVRWPSLYRSMGATRAPRKKARGAVSSQQQTEAAPL